MGRVKLFLDDMSSWEALPPLKSPARQEWVYNSKMGCNPPEALIGSRLLML